VMQIQADRVLVLVSSKHCCSYTPSLSTS